jgi:large subunit ribosomal protein L25
MAKQIKLSAQTRSGAGRTEVKKLRAEGKVPAVIYGSSQAALNLQLGAREVVDALKHSTGEQMLVELEIHDGEKSSSKLALIQEVQHHPVRSTILHVDFHAVAADEKLHAHVTVEVHGEAVGVKTYGGRLELLLHSIEVECLPKDLPELISIDVASLNVGDAIHLRDVKLPAGVSFSGDGELTVLRIAGATTADEPAAAEGPSQPEVIREKKPVEGADKK